MLYLCAFRPIDPGVEIDTADSDKPKPIGWLVITLTREHANALLDRHQDFCDQQDKFSDLLNMTFALPRDNEITIYNPCDELSELWTRHRIGESKLARLPEDFDVATLGETAQIGQEPLIDITIQTAGVWYQIFLPALQYSVESAFFTRETLLTAAGLPAPTTEGSPTPDAAPEQTE